MGPVRNRRALKLVFPYILLGGLNAYWGTAYPNRAFFYNLSAATFGVIALIWLYLAFRRYSEPEE